VCLDTPYGRGDVPQGVGRPAWLENFDREGIWLLRSCPSSSIQATDVVIHTFDKNLVGTVQGFFPRGHRHFGKAAVLWESEPKVGKVTYINPGGLERASYAYPLTLHACQDAGKVEVTCTNLAGDTIAVLDCKADDCVMGLRASVLRRLDTRRRNVTLLLEDGGKVDRSSANMTLAELFRL